MGVVKIVKDDETSGGVNVFLNLKGFVNELLIWNSSSRECGQYYGNYHITIGKFWSCG